MNPQLMACGRLLEPDSPGLAALKRFSMSSRTACQVWGGSMIRSSTRDLHGAFFKDFAADLNLAGLGPSLPKPRQTVCRGVG
jgi:hypothetical protein